jgi:hypothetical protein
VASLAMTTRDEERSIKNAMTTTKMNANATMTTMIVTL